MIGQSKLLNRINMYTKFPNSVIMIGTRGSEQDDVCKYISYKFNLNYVSLKEISDDIITEIRMSSVNSLYVVNILDISDREQSILLKLYEEPSPYAHIIILAESLSNVLETLITRSTAVLNMDTYTDSELSDLIVKDTELTLKVARTPGLVDIANHTNLNNMQSICEKMIDVISTASFSNTLSIANKINFKDNYDKFDLYLFIKMLKLTAFDKCCLNAYELISNLDYRIWEMNDKERYFISFLIEFWKESRKISLQS